ncbi:MAG TPA: ATP-binding protein [Planctomycetaceae bacterium]|jgi:signal transduction histidine kinase|nr:ATP-binding protein [Planctomycetaceae bacterium]
MADPSTSNEHVLAENPSGRGEAPSAPRGDSIAAGDAAATGQLRRQYEEVAALAGGLAHEIRNPLSTIGMLLELMAEDLEAPETPRDRRIFTQVKTLQRECRHLEEILNAFLQFARLGELELVACDLNQLVRDFIEFYKAEASDHGIEISPHLASDLPHVRADRSLFRQMLLNLALNAQQAMPDGGIMELQTSFEKGSVQLAIIDNGLGIDEATQAKLFDVFFSTKVGGSGLGLPTVRKIVEAHQGRIACQSELGRGTRFVISFPPAQS